MNDFRKTIHSKRKRNRSDPLHRLMDSLPLGLHQYTLHASGELIFSGANSAADRILGIEHQSLIGKPIETAFPNLAHTETADMYRQIARNGGRYEREFLTYQDEQVAGTFKVQAFQTGPACMAVFFQDISHQKQAEQARVESEERYRSLVELSPDCIAVHSQGKIVFINPAGIRLLGVRSAEDLIGKSVLDFTPAEDRPRIVERMIQMAQGLSVPPLEERFIRPDGSIIEGELRAASILYQGKPAVLLVGRDISTQKQAQQAIRESERHLRTLIEAAPLGLHQYELLADGRLILSGANSAADQILGINHQGMIGLPIEDAFPMHHQTEIPALYRQVALEGTPYSAEQITYQDNQIQGVFEIQAFQTGPSRMAVFFQNTTTRKRAEEALRESEKKFRALVEQNSEGVVLSDEQGRVIEWNAAQERSSGIPREEALGRPVWELQYRLLLPEQQRPAFLEVMKEKVGRILQTGQSPTFYQPFEVSICKPDGNRVLIQQTAFPIQTNLGFRIGSIMRDVTQRKQAELDLQRRMIELEVLHAVALAGTEALSTDDLLERVSEIIHEKLYPDYFGVAFVDERAQVLAYHPSFIRGSCLAAVEVPLNRGITGRVARTGVPRRTADVRLDPDYLEGNPNILAELCVPIIIAGRVIGVVNLESVKLGSFTEADERLLTAIAGELGVALEKVRLLEAEQNRRKELEALEQISAVLRTEVDQDQVLQAVLERVMAVMNLQGAGIILYEPQTRNRVTQTGQGLWALANQTHHPQFEEISQQVADTQHYYLDNEIGSDPRLQGTDPTLLLKSLLCLALIVENQTVGLLYLGRSTDFLPADVHLAIAMADVLASTLHRMDLHAQTQRQLERLTGLRAIDQSILSRLDLEHTLDVLLQKVTGLLQVDAANFLLIQPNTQTLIPAGERGLPAGPIWDPSREMEATHAGRAALSRQMELISDLSQIEDSLTEKIREIGENFTGYAAVPLAAKGELIGVLQVFTHARLEPSQDWLGFLEALADQAAIAIHSAQMFNEQQQTHANLTQAYEDTIDGWSRALDLRDEETHGHSLRVTDLTLELARRMGVPEEQLVHIRRGALLHDIGKMGVPDKILLKPGPLNEEEWLIMQKHPLYAANLLYPINFLHPAIDIPYCHHEKWDGTGYPQGLKGEEIPLSARIFALIDVWDALTHHRPYRSAWSKETAFAYLQEQSGKHFDPQVVEKFLAWVQENPVHPVNQS
jgi:PAS domain S-box-containing protein/putative nucleotidyltransferase with HDIG domain